MNDTRRRIRHAIRQILEGFVDQPFLLLREIGLQAKLWGILDRDLNAHQLAAQVVTKSKNSKHQHSREFTVGRVQLELKVGGNDRTDIVVFRTDRKPRLTCWQGGPTDIVARVEPDDVEAVIELKASPSRTKEQRAAYDADLEKLFEIHKKHRHIQCYFVLVDKSLSVPGAVCDPSVALASWTERKMRELTEENVGDQIEVWDLENCDKPKPRLRYLDEVETTIANDTGTQPCFDGLLTPR